MSIIKKTLKCGAEVVWSVPLSGYGHVADEQPSPYIHYNGKALTPRFGGEESEIRSGIETLPLPYGQLKGGWSVRQKVFNFFRRKINLYWRNIFSNFTNESGAFHFIEQLKFSEIENGFIGRSPILFFSREFICDGNSVTVRDKIKFLSNIEFDFFHLAPYAELKNTNLNIQSTEVCNYTKEISSSTGQAIWMSRLIKNVKFHKHEELMWQYQYQVKP